jgi:hypothetical protein
MRGTKPSVSCRWQRHGGEYTTHNPKHITKMQLRKKIDVDVVRDVLEAAVAGYPNNAFVKSLLRQYDERGGLSRKQLEGLHAKALKLNSIPPQKLATLDAIIQKKPVRTRSEKPEPKPLFEKDEATGRTIADILAKYPSHKRVLFLQAKHAGNDTLTPVELDELAKFRKLLLKD